MAPFNGLAFGAGMGQGMSFLAQMGFQQMRAQQNMRMQQQIMQQQAQENFARQKELMEMQWQHTKLESEQQKADQMNAILQAQQMPYQMLNELLMKKEAAKGKEGAAGWTAGDEAQLKNLQWQLGGQREYAMKMDQARVSRAGGRQPQESGSDLFGKVNAYYTGSLTDAMKMFGGDEGRAKVWAADNTNRQIDAWIADNPDKAKEGENARDMLGIRPVTLTKAPTAAKAPQFSAAPTQGQSARRKVVKVLGTANKAISYPIESGIADYQKWASTPEGFRVK